MEYRAICKINHLNYEKILNRGKAIHKNMRLSNSDVRFNREFNEDSFKELIGTIAFEDFKDSHFIYKVGTDKSFDSEYPLKGLNRFLVNIQTFISLLWFVKDNSVSMEEGYVYLKENGKDISVSVNSRTVSFTNARGERDEVTFKEDEIDRVITIYNSLNKLYNKTDELADGKSIIFSNLEFSVNRIERFLYLLQATRNESYIPMRIALYTTMLEALISTSRGSLAHSVAERTAWLIGNSNDERKEIFRFIKKMYSIRSSVLHGDKLNKSFKNKSYKDFKDYSQKYDGYIRKIINKILRDKNLNDLYNKNNRDEINKYYTNLILGTLES